MLRVWVIAPFDADCPEVWEAVWDHQLAQSTISIGWRALGDVSSLDEEAVYERMRQEYPDKTPGAARNATRMLQKFYRAVEPGDTIVARRGRKQIAGIGTVSRTAWYDPDLLTSVLHPFGPEFERIAYPHHLGVEWQSDLRNIEYDEQVFGLTTLYEIPEEKLRWLLEDDEDGECGPVEIDDDASNPTPKKQVEFALEKYLEDFIVSNFASVFDGRLSLFSDPDEGPIGQQYQTEVGVIDILAQDVSSGDFVVIELKKGRAADKVVGQVLKYMGWVAENLCSESQHVCGLIICREHDLKLEYALKMVNNVAVNYYRVDFTLHDKPPTAT